MNDKNTVLNDCTETTHRSRLEIRLLNQKEVFPLGWYGTEPATLDIDGRSH